MSYLLDDLMGFEKTADRKIRYDYNGKTMFLELAGSSDTEENIKMYLDGAKRSGMKAQVVPRDTPYDKPKAGQEKVAGESVFARYKKIDWDNDPTGEKKKIKRKLIASGILAGAGFGATAHQVIQQTRDAVQTNFFTEHPKSGKYHAKLNHGYGGVLTSAAGLLSLERQLKKAEQEKTAGDVVDFASHAKKIADRNALKAKFVNPEDPIRKAQGAIQAYLDKEKERQAESEMRWSKINDLQASIDSDMEQLRQMDEREAKVKLRNKKVTKSMGVAGAGLATLGGGAYLYNRYKKKKRAQAEQEKTAAPMFGKDRYRPVDNLTKGQTFNRELQLMDDDKKKGLNYDPAYYKKIKGAEEKANKAFFRNASGKMVSAVSLVAASRNAKKGIKAALSGDKDAANRYKKLTGIASIYPTYRLAKNLKNRYHWSKQENIDQDNAFRKKEQEIDNRWNQRFSPNGDPDDDDFDYNKSNTDDLELLELIKMEKRKKGH